MTWLLAAAAYATACFAAAAYVIHRRPAASVRSTRSVADSEDVLTTEHLKHEVDELRSRLLEALADASQQQRRTAHEVMLNRHQTSNIEKRLGPVETGIEFLRGRSEQQQFDDWVESGALSSTRGFGDE